MVNITNTDILKIASVREVRDSWEVSLRRELRKFQEEKRQQEMAKKQALHQYNLGKISSDELMLTLIGEVQ